MSTLQQHRLCHRLRLLNHNRRLYRLRHLNHNVQNMGFDIKTLKPNKNGRYKQGYLDKSQCKKLVCESNEPVIYRSGLELKFIKYCETNPLIKRWGSEIIKIDYYNPLREKMCEYFPDYVIEHTDGQKFIVEIKPYEQTKKPRKKSSQWLKEQYVINVSKWRAAQAYAAANNVKFVVVTERFFGH